MMGEDEESPIICTAENDIDRAFRYVDLGDLVTR
jgi:hypothetical protein